MKVAIVHDWLLGMRGGERCLEVLLKMFPEADLYTAFYDSEAVTDIIKNREVYTSCLQKIPGAKYLHRYLLPLYPLASRSISSKLNKKKYDLVISVSHCLAKNIEVPVGAYHVCYCLTPMRYIWDKFDSYFADKWYKPIASVVAKYLRSWDQRKSSSVDCYIAISHFIAERIKKYYGRESHVIYPPVRTDWIEKRKEGERGEGFLCVSALVPYKNVDAIVRAFNELPEKLFVVGDGPERSSIEKLASSNVKFLGKISDSELAQLYKKSKALIFAAEEEFGMVPVEMQAAGRPVICLGQGGSLETVSVNGKYKTGIYFSSLEQKHIISAIEQFTVQQDDFTVDNCINYAKNFSEQNFCSQFLELLGKSDVKKALAAI